jgi:hypothetical protein
VHGQDPDVHRLARAWSAEEWEAAGERLARRGLLDGTSATDAGRAEHQAIEARTDELSAELYARARSADERDALVDDLGRLAAPVLAAGLYPSPNPMGLPVPEPS